MLIHIWLILIYCEIYFEKMNSLINDEIISLNAVRVVYLMPNLGTG